VRAVFLPIVLGILASPASAQSLQVVGYSGYLGEWELTAAVTETGFWPYKGILRAIDDEAHRGVHSGWSGGEDR
jgi:hypothetical protein